MITLAWLIKRTFSANANTMAIRHANRADRCTSSESEVKESQEETNTTNLDLIHRNHIVRGYYISTGQERPRLEANLRLLITTISAAAIVEIRQ